MATIAVLKKRSKTLKKASKKFYDKIDKEVNSPVSLSKDESNMVAETIISVSKGVLPKFSKKQALKFQDIAWHFSELGVKKITFVTY